MQWLDVRPDSGAFSQDATAGQEVGTRLTWRILAGGQTRLREQSLSNMTQEWFSRC